MIIESLTANVEIKASKWKATTQHFWYFTPCFAIRWDACQISVSLQWLHNERDGVSNHQTHDCLLKRLFRHRSQKISKLRVTGLCEGKSPVTGEFPAQRASNAENISTWWRHHVDILRDLMVRRFTAAPWIDAPGTSVNWWIFTHCGLVTRCGIDMVQHWYQNILLWYLRYVHHLYQLCQQNSEICGIKTDWNELWVCFYCQIL